MQETKALISRWRGSLGVVLERRPQCALSHEVRRRGQWASRGAPGTSFLEDNFSTDWGLGEGWFWDDSSALHLLCTLFILFLHQLHHSSSVIWSQRLILPAIRDPYLNTILKWESFREKSNNNLCLYVRFIKGLSYCIQWPVILGGI